MSRNRRYFGTNRYVCSVLEEIRKCHETRNYAILLSLVEEVQTMVNRMESGLDDKRDIKEMADYRSELKKEIRQLEDQLQELKKQCPDTTKESD